MTSVDSLMLGGYEPDNYTDADAVSDFDLWVEELEDKAKKMSNEELEFEIDWEKKSNNLDVASIYEYVLNNRLVVDVPPCTSAWYQDDPDHEDRRKEKLENYGPVEPDELPV